LKVEALEISPINVKLIFENVETLSSQFSEIAYMK